MATKPAKQLDDALAAHTAARWAFETGYYGYALKMLSEAQESLGGAIEALEWPAKYRPYRSKR